MIKINLMKGDCLERMKEIPDKSVDMVLTDPPYGTTACKWDSVIPFKEMWVELKRVIRNEKSAIVLFGSEPFSSILRASNIVDFKYDWIWHKTRPGDVFNAKNKPMKTHETISVFSSGTTANGSSRKMVYFPQGVSATSSRKDVNNFKGKQRAFIGDRPSLAEKYTPHGSNYPRSILKFSNDNHASFHPTQKPVALLEYLIKTYTLEGETVLDFTMGSGSTGVACKNLNRNFIGIERDDKYFEIAEKRILE